MGARAAPSAAARGVTNQISNAVPALIPASKVNMPRQSVNCSTRRTGSVADAAPRPPAAIK